MRHRKQGRKFGRTTKVRMAMLRSLVNNLLINGRITTTVEKAKDARVIAEKMITKAKKGLLDREKAETLEKDVKPVLDQIKKDLTMVNGRKLPLNDIEFKTKVNEKCAADETFKTKYNDYRTHALAFVHRYRTVLSKLHDKNAVSLLFGKKVKKDDTYTLEEGIAQRYLTRKGGYTRILKIGTRKGDTAEMAIFELV